MMNNWPKNITIVSAVFVLNACSVTPELVETPLQLETQYLYASDGDENIQQNHVNLGTSWWESFDDPYLNELVYQVQSQNLSLKVAAERVKGAQAYHQAIESFKVPTVSLSAGYSNFGLSENESLGGAAVTPIAVPNLGGVQLVDDNHSNVFVGANIAWEADLFGRIDAYSNAAAIGVEQVEYIREGLLIALTADVIDNYLQMRGTQERQVIVQQSIDDQEKSLQLIGTLVEHGMASGLDQARAKAMLSSTQAILPMLETAEVVHQQRIAILIGDNSPKLKERLSQADDLPDFEGVIPVGLPSELLLRRPDIRVAELQMHKVNEELGAAIAAKYPKVYLTGSPGLVASDFGDLFKSGSAGWVAGVGVNWTLFDGGRSDAVVDMQEANLTAAALSYQQSVNMAFAEVDTLLKAYGDNMVRTGEVTDAQNYGSEALNQAHALYQAGLIDQLTLIDAQRQQLSLDDQALGAQLNTAQLVVHLHKALGGEWDITKGDVMADTVVQ